MLRTTATLWLLFVTLSLSAQIVVDGRTAYYDTLTNTFLVSVPEDYDVCSLPYSIPDNLNIEFTHLPIIRLEGTFGRQYSLGTLSLSLPNDTTTQHYTMRAKYRGALTNSDDKHKRNFHLRLVDDEGEKTNKYLLGLRKDDSYLLDAGQVDLGRIRNHVAHEIWRDMGNKPYYADLEPDAKNYIDCEFVEVFINDEYFGLYSLTEAMDRKQMKLKKYDKGTLDIHGILYKAISWEYTMMYSPFDAPDNNGGSWGGFDVKYPEIDDVCPTDWDPLYDAMVFVNESSAGTFRTNVEKYFDIPVLIDYYLFHNVIGATDHGGKNMYWACYDIPSSPMLTIAIWDYDTMIGQTRNNAEVHSNSYGPRRGTLLTNAEPNILHRLVADNVNYFIERAVTRYWELRPTVFDADSLANRFNDYYSMLRRSGTLQRETARWSGDTDINGYPLDFDDEQEYINDWLQNRMTYLDGIFYVGVGIISVENDVADTDETRYNLAGQRVREGYKGIVISKGKKVLVR